MKCLIFLVFVSGCYSNVLNDQHSKDIYENDQYNVGDDDIEDYNKYYEEYRFNIGDGKTSDDDKKDNVDLNAPKDRVNYDDDDKEKNLSRYNQELREEKIRPCVLDDLDCIRKFLATNSHCKPQYGPRPDPLLIPVDKFFIPIVNLTITHVNLHVEGFKSANITEFYVNKYTGNLVMAINVQRVTQTAPKSYFTYQRTAKEAIVLSDFTTVTYDSITFTVIIPKVPHLKLELAEIHADVHDGSPAYVVGPRAYNSTDPDVVSAYAQFLANIPNVIREAYVFQSYLLTGVYIEKTLCDFGVDVYKNYLHFIKTKAFTNVPGHVLRAPVLKKIDKH